MSEAAIKEVQVMLSAFPADVVNEALKRHGNVRRGRRAAEKGWTLWEGEGIPPKPFEWKKLGERTYYRQPGGRTEKQTTASATERGKAIADGKAKICPDCGAQAFAQSVCPKCAKGKAGIRKQWVCGENDNHVFYTE